MKVLNGTVQTSQYITIFKSMAQGLSKCSCPDGSEICFIYGTIRLDIIFAISNNWTLCCSFQVKS
jgi:hypothetical protein